MCQKNFCSRWIPHNLTLVQKKARNGRKKYYKNTTAVLRNTSITSWQVMNRGFTRMNPKVNSSRLYGCFKMGQIQQKLLAHEEFPSNWSLIFWKNWTCRSGTQPFVCQFSSEKSREPTAEDGSLFTTTLRALTHRLKQLHFWEIKTSIWWIIRRKVLTWHRMTSFYART